ncbi:MAG: peptidase M48 [Nitrospirae bacterium]|nr:MAG: peptidase M48 [Nitrospirota bacterium]
MLLLMDLMGFIVAGIDGVYWATIMGLIFLIFGPRFSPTLILRLYGAKPLSPVEAPSIYRIVEELSEKAKLPVLPRVYYIPSIMMNALSVGSHEDPIIALTDGLIRNLTLRELRGVIAHEISHIKHNDMKVMSVADTISRVTYIFSMSGQILLILNLPLMLIGTGAIPWLFILLLIFAPTLSALMQLSLSRTREFDADLEAAKLTKDPLALAMALKKIETYGTTFLKRILMPGSGIPEPSVFRTHPKTEERIKRLIEIAEELQEKGELYDDNIPLLPQNIKEVNKRPRWHFGGIWY